MHARNTSAEFMHDIVVWSELFVQDGVVCMDRVVGLAMVSDLILII